jgi:hypothetical protein
MPHADRGQAEVDRCGGEASLFHVDPISKHNGAIEGKSRFRTVPIHELIDRMIIRSLAAFSKSGYSVRQTSSVRDRVGQENASVVSSFFGVWAFRAASSAAFSQNCPQTPYCAVTGDLSFRWLSFRRGRHPDHLLDEFEKGRIIRPFFQRHNLM